MNKNVLKGTKVEIKNSSASKKKKQTSNVMATRRGRPRYIGPMKAFNCDLPEIMITEMKNLEKNKTEYVAQLILADFKKRGVKETILSKISTALTKEVLKG